MVLYNQLNFDSLKLSTNLSMTSTSSKTGRQVVGGVTGFLEKRSLFPKNHGISKLVVWRSSEKLRSKKVKHPSFLEGPS